MRELNGRAVCEGEGPRERRRAVPVLHARGSHYDVGFDVGRTFGALIKRFLGSYGNLRQFEQEYRTAAGRRAYEATFSAMRRRFPHYLREMQGTADGAGVPFHQLFLLQMDDVIGTAGEREGERRPRPDTGGCSTVGVLGPDHDVLGHTEDAFADLLNHFYILCAHITPDSEEKALGAVEERFSSLCYAGHLPGYTMGYNAHGLVFTINTLSPRALKPGSTPRTFITRALLAARSWPEAERVLRDEGLGAANGFSVNMLWSAPSARRRLLNAEVAPDPAGARSLLAVLEYHDEPLVHCNIYQRLPVKEVVGPIVDSSKARLTALRARPTPRRREDVAAMLSDKTGKHFQVFQDRSDAVIKTIAVGIFDMERMTWSIYITAPADSEPVAVLPIVFTSL